MATTVRNKTVVWYNWVTSPQKEQLWLYVSRQVIGGASRRLVTLSQLTCLLLLLILPNADARGTCGGTLVGGGVIHSPNYPGNYSNNITCEWTLQGYNNTNIFLQVRSLYTEQGKDFLRIADAFGFQLSLSGRQKSRNLTLSSPANVSFTSNDVITGPGFLMDFRSVARSQGRACGGTLIGHGFVKSPNYPGNYSKKFRCSWMLRGYNGTAVFLQIRHYYTKPGKDNMRITSASGLQVLLSGQLEAQNLTLTSPANLTFMTDGIETGQGFEMEFSSIPLSQDKRVGEDAGRLTTCVASVIPLLAIFGAVAVTIGVIARKKQLNVTTVFPCRLCQGVSSESGCEQHVAPQSSDTVQESAYASLSVQDVESSRHMYSNVLQRNSMSTNATVVGAYDNVTVEISSQTKVLTSFSTDDSNDKNCASPK